MKSTTMADGTRMRFAGVAGAALLIAGATLLIADSARAQSAEESESGPSLEEISRALDNPLGNLWLIFMENDTMRFRGNPAPGSKWVNSFTFQPILPIPLTENWNLVSRPIIPFITAPKLDISASAFGDCPGNCNSIPPDKTGLFDLDASRENGWGDIMLWSMLTPAEPRELSDGGKFVWGLGPAFRFPTATEDQFGSERYTVGPSSILMRLPPRGGKWTYGLFQQHHIWSFGGNSGRDRVKTSQFQYIWWYKLPTRRDISIGAFPMIDVNWEAENDDKWSVPIGLGAATTFFLGKMPVRMGVEFDWFVVSPDNYGKKFMIKFFFVPVLPRLIKEPVLARK